MSKEITNKIKSIWGIVKYVQDADFHVESADLKMKILELVTYLDSVREELNEKDQEIKDLKEALKWKHKLTRVPEKAGYYVVNEQGFPIDGAFCSKCFESDSKAIHVLRKKSCGHNNDPICPVCNTTSADLYVYHVKTHIKGFDKTAFEKVDEAEFGKFVYYSPENSIIDVDDNIVYFEGKKIVGYRGKRTGRYKDCYVLKELMEIEKEKEE